MCQQADRLETTLRGCQEHLRALRTGVRKRMQTLLKEVGNGAALQEVKRICPIIEEEEARQCDLQKAVQEVCDMAWQST